MQDVIRFIALAIKIRRCTQPPYCPNSYTIASADLHRGESFRIDQRRHVPIPACGSNEAMDLPAYICKRTAGDKQMTIRCHRGIAQRKVAVTRNNDLRGGLVLVPVVEIHAGRT